MNPHIFRALRYRNFRLFVIGQMLSASGTWMQRVAQAWLAYRLTGSSFYLGLVAFAGSAPAFLLAPLAGVLADRVDRHRLLIWTQVFELAQAAALAAFTLTGAITPAWLLLLALAQGILNAFENPTRQSFYSGMVDLEDLSNAIALNASQTNVARILGPAVAGVLVAVWGEGVCFSVNALSYLAVIVALLMMQVERREPIGVARRGSELLLEGFAFVRRTRTLRDMLSNFAILSLAGSPYLTLLPILAVETLRAGPTGLGWLVSASGVGAIVSSLVLASRSTTRGLAAASFAATVTFGAALIVLGFSRNFFLSLVAMLLIGGGYVFTLAATQTMMQSWVSEEMRGRVMSFYSMIFLGVPPLGSLLAGIIAEKIHAPLTVALGGAVCLAGALYFARGQLLEERAAAPG